MLKRKLHKASFITGSFVLIAVSSGSKSIINTPGDSTTINCRKVLHDSTASTFHAFDSAGLCICLSEMPEDLLNEAPRIKLNKNATRFVTDHHKKNAAGLEKLRSSRYFTMIDSILTQKGVPVELKYLAVIESRLNTRATSRVGAKGMWQFMAVTAREYGLKVKGKYDERLYAYKSTVAAAKYLNYLYSLFDDWLLTIAAYNSGPGYVYAAIKKSGSRNFWVLQNFLPKETRNHVKIFISTHYFFEGHGSLATLTRSETNAHIKAVADFTEKQREFAKQIVTDSLPAEATEVTLAQQ